MKVVYKLFRKFDRGPTPRSLGDSLTIVISHLQVLVYDPPSKAYPRMVFSMFMEHPPPGM